MKVRIFTIYVYVQFFVHPTQLQTQTQTQTQLQTQLQLQLQLQAQKRLLLTTLIPKINLGGNGN